MDVPVAGSLEVNIKTMDSKIYNTIVPPGSMVLDLKVLLKEKTLVSEDRQRLIYRGRVLEDDKAVAFYDITPGNTLHMIARPENYRELQHEAAAPALPSAAADETAVAAVGTGTGAGSSALSAPILEYLFGQSLRGNTGAATGSPAAATGTEGESMEPLWQSLLSMLTLLSVTGGRESGVGAELSLASLGFSADEISMSAGVEGQEGATSGSEGGSVPVVEHSAEAETGASPPASRERSWNHAIRYFEGQWLDVKDTVAQWLEATVMEVDLSGRRIFVHYNGWPQRWDEWLPFESARVAPFRSMTRHTTTSGRNLLSPEPVTRLPDAGRVGATDPRFVLLELARMTRRIQPILDEAAEAVERSMVMSPAATGPVLATEASPTLPSETPPSTPAAAPSPTVRFSPFASPVGATIPPTPAGESPDTSALRLAELSSQLCPLLDRMGRLMTDFAPHLRTAADGVLSPAPGAEASAAEDTSANNNPFQTSSSSPQEMALAALLRQRPASPEPERAFRQPIARRSPGGMNGLGSTISSLGGNGHVDITLSILSPRDLVQRNVERNALTRTLSSLNTVLNLHSLIAEHESPAGTVPDAEAVTIGASPDGTSSVVIPLTAANMAASTSVETPGSTTIFPVPVPVPEAAGPQSAAAAGLRTAHSSSDSLQSDGLGAAPQDRRARGAAAAPDAGAPNPRRGSMIRSIGRMFGFGR